MRPAQPALRDYRSKYLELSTVKQAIAWFREEQLLPETMRVKMRLRKPEGTSTRCWTEAQIGIVLDYCNKHPTLHWLGNIILLMALTGLRISEVRDLRWTDIDWESKAFRLQDETAIAQKDQESMRTLKGGRGRSFPIHDRLVPTLEPRKASSVRCSRVRRAVA